MNFSNSSGIFKCLVCTHLFLMVFEFTILHSKGLILTFIQAFTGKLFCCPISHLLCIMNNLPMYKFCHYHSKASYTGNAVNGNGHYWCVHARKSGLFDLGKSLQLV